MLTEYVITFLQRAGHQQSADVGGVNFSLKSKLWSHLQMFGDYIETRVTTILL
jgi:hypothetical protein